VTTELCMEHSGCDARIGTLEKNEVDIFRRLHELEKAVWKAAGTSGIITAIVVVLLERMLK